MVSNWPKDGLISKMDAKIYKNKLLVTYQRREDSVGAYSENGRQIYNQED